MRSFLVGGEDFLKFFKQGKDTCLEVNAHVVLTPCLLVEVSSESVKVRDLQHLSQYVQMFLPLSPRSRFPGDVFHKI